MDSENLGRQQQTGFQEPVFGETRTEERAAVREDRKEEPGSQCDLVKEVWKTPYGDITAVAVYVQRLRRKIEKDPANPEFLKTIFGKGYLFKKDEAE